MLSVNGLYGHVRHNDVLSTVVFLGFVLSFQLLAAALLTPILLISSLTHVPFINPVGYLQTFGLPVLGVSVVWFGFALWQHVRWMQAETGYSNTTRRSEPRLVNAACQMAVQAGIPEPAVAIIETEARNAFACGLTQRSAVVVVTRGLINALDDAELAAVIAHEVVHIRNNDTRLMAAANAMLLAVLQLQGRAHFLRLGWLRYLVFFLFPPLFILAKGKGFVVRLAMGVAFLSRLVISRSREFVADAEAVRMTHDPAALISALCKIQGCSDIEDISPAAEAMMIDGASEGRLATHPTIEERIAVLRQHAGSMLHSSGVRKDTRDFRVAAAARGTFGQRRQLQPKVEARPSLIAQALTAPPGTKSMSGAGLKYILLLGVIFFLPNFFGLLMLLFGAPMLR